MSDALSDEEREELAVERPFHRPPGNIGWREGASMLRDFRHTKTDGVTSGDKRRKKDKQKWCKGHVGREHELKIVERPAPGWVCQRDAWWPCKHQEVCTRCGKVTRWQIPVEECPTLTTVTRKA